MASGTVFGGEGFARATRWFAKKSFRFFEQYFHLHLTPAHYYSPLPNTNELHPRVFSKVFACPGLDWNLASQREHLEQVFPRYVAEYTPAANTGLSLADAFVLYAMIRRRRPRIMVEIGAGSTTRISLEAIARNRGEGHECRLISIEPYPGAFLREIRLDYFELLERKLQDVDPDLVSSADLLFIDSSHVSKIDSDVNMEILEVVPRVKVGTLVHWHDIVLPTDYWKDWITSGNMFWNESYMVHAFMLFNDAFKIVWGGRYMQLNHFDALQELWPYLRREHRMMSFWIERVR